MIISLPSDFNIKNTSQIIDQYRTVDFNFYGSHQTNPLAGGRPIYRIPEVDPDHFEAYIRYFNNNGIEFKYILTSNRSIEYQKASSYIQYLINAGIDSFVIRNNDLLPIIRKHKSDARIIKSLIDGEYTAAGVDECISSGYDLVSINIHRISKIDHLLPILPYSDNIELLINSCCVQMCPNSTAHYQFYEDSFQKENDLNDRSFIDIWNLNCTIEFMENPGNFLSCSFFTRKILNQLIDLGFYNFKIAGRGGSHAQLLSILQYYLDPECNKSSFDIMTRSGMKYLTPFMNILGTDELNRISKSICQTGITDFDEGKYSYFNSNSKSINDVVGIDRIDEKWLTKMKRIRELIKDEYMIDLTTKEHIVNILLEGI